LPDRPALSDHLRPVSAHPIQHRAQQTGGLGWSTRGLSTLNRSSCTQRGDGARIHCRA
jgi:hypothetical protein